MSGLFGFGTAIGVHFVIGYTDSLHLAPAYAGLGIYLVGLAISIARHDKTEQGPR